MEGLSGRHNRKKPGPCFSVLLASPISSLNPEISDKMPYSVAQSCPLLPTHTPSSTLKLSIIFLLRKTTFLQVIFFQKFEINLKPRLYLVSSSAFETHSVLSRA